jgi:hypothetical protein
MYFIVLITFGVLVIGGALTAILYATIPRRSNTPPAQTFTPAPPQPKPVLQSTQPQWNFTPEQQGVIGSVLARRNELAPWGSRTSRDIIAAADHTWFKAFTRTVKGKIYSIDGSRVIAFERVERGMGSAGYMFAAASDWHIYFDIRDYATAFMFNGEWIGFVNGNGSIKDNNGNDIGFAQHPPRAQFDIGINNLPRFGFRTGSRSFPFTINGRQLATIHVAPDLTAFDPMKLFQFNENLEGSRIIQLHDTPTPEEEKWLLCFAVLEVGHHGMWMM